MKVNDVIGKIMDDEPVKYGIYLHGTLVSITCPADDQHLTVARYDDIDCEVRPIYPDYLHDANEALRAYMWLCNQYRGKGESLPVLHGCQDEWFLHWGKGRRASHAETACHPICWAVITYAEQFQPDLLDYNDIEWE